MSRKPTGLPTKTTSSRVPQGCPVGYHGNPREFPPFFFSILFIIFALLFSLPPGRNSDPGSHSRLFSPPTHHYGSCLAFLSREYFSSFFPRRLASNCPMERINRRVPHSIPPACAFSAVFLPPVDIPHIQQHRVSVPIHPRLYIEIRV